jgi:hypothetical protein
MPSKAKPKTRKKGKMTARDLRRFLDSYRKFQDQQVDLRLQQFQRDFTRLKISLEPLIVHAKEQDIEFAKDFNIFDLLGRRVTLDEVYTHSALLAELLDPEGAHSQKHLFLAHFLHHCQSMQSNEGNAFPLVVDDITDYKWFVEKERPIPTGCLDLVISSPDRGFMLVIENKITALERTDQLRDYADWLQAQSHKYAKRALIYLTPTGRGSTSNGHREYYPMSYHRDIAAWLRCALDGIEAPRVKEVLIQYLQIIQKL